MRITRHEEFEVAHLLPGYNGGCGRLHGHTYKIEVTVQGDQKEQFDMVADFKIVKQAIKDVVPDHYFVYYKEDEISKKIADVLRSYNIDCIEYPFYTTAENMVTYYANTIEDILRNTYGLDVCIAEVKLWETTNSYATWKKEDYENVRKK